MRYALALAGFASALFAPPWLTLLLMGALAFRYPAWEVLFIGFFADMLWLPPGFLHPLPVFTLAGIILVWGLEPLRKEFLFS